MGKDGGTFITSNVRLGKRPARFERSPLAKSHAMRFSNGMRPLPPLLLLSLLLFPAAASARDALGIFEGWGAFRDPGVPRCYAIAEPARRSAARGNWRAFASIATWPRQQARGQVHFRLSRARRDGTPAALSIGDRRFALVAGSADAWARDRQNDAAIIAAIRSGTSMSVSAIDAAGRPFADVYALRGAATAIDAAALGCARLR